MKIILAGATGFLGSEVLRQCIAKSSYVQHVYAVVRKPLEDRKLAQDPKCTEIVLEDFEQWPQHLLELFKQEGVRGCIWCIGGPVGSFKDLETAQRVNIALPQAAAEAFAVHVAPTASELQSMPKNSRGNAFRFVYASMVGAEQNQFASLWSQAQTRKAKGAAEKGLFEYADSRDPGTFEAYALRFGQILPGGQSVYNIMQESMRVVISDALAAKKMISIVLEGRKQEEGGRLLENADCFGEDWADINTVGGL
ncbi:hypothetical protein AAFC00_002977 [Neodothiora populina]|uniref:NAD(P)-binding domain-containing protein n=1 Tax=Neodothiora populina TaxID=2781224 RepID=A0ABR3PA68_9PEZI